MNAVQKWIALFVVAMGIASSVDAQSLRYQLTRVAGGYQVTGLPAELMADFQGLAADTELVMSLIDPALGTSRVRGVGRKLGDSSLLFSTSESLAFQPDPNRTYLTLELREPAAAGSCSGCPLTNPNLKSRSPQMCWCLTRLTASGGTDARCGGAESLVASAAASALLKLLGNSGRTQQVYGECYPSSGEGGEDCSAFLTICKEADGGAGSLPGGGYSCSVN